MITRENLTEIVKSLDKKDQNRLKRTDKEYAVLFLHISNSGYVAQLRLTDDFTRYQNVSNNGDCILEAQEVLGILNSQP